MDLQKPTVERQETVGELQSHGVLRPQSGKPQPGRPCRADAIAAVP